jgi:hypothetical protein
MRDWFVYQLADGVRGKADLVAYMFTRIARLLNATGTLGIVATNTLGQGQSREVGLDPVVGDGFKITRAIQSKPWPASGAALEYAAVWGTWGGISQSTRLIANDQPVAGISTLLEGQGRTGLLPVRLAANAGVTFEGCKPYGAGFVIDSELANSWLQQEPRYSEVVFPYLSGDDLTSRPDTSASRWIIDFYDRTLEEAAKYHLPFERVELLVKPERLKANRKAIRERWWQYADKRPGMRRAIADLDKVIVLARVSKTVMPIMVRSDQVLSDSLTVFATSDFSSLAVLSSSFHQLWAITYGSTLETRIRYTPSDVFETFPLPDATEVLSRIGKTLDEERRAVMRQRDLGLTKLYNLASDPDIGSSADSDVSRMRDIHVEIDEAALDAFGWADIKLHHGFHTYRQMERWTVSPAARVEILDRLLEENHRRAALEEATEPALKGKGTRGKKSLDDGEGLF